MKSIKILLFLFAFVLSSGLIAQDFQGVATYKTSTTLDMTLDSNMANADQQKMIMQMLNQYLQKEFTLTFSKSKSIYKEIEKLEENQMPFAGMVSSITGTGGTFFKDIKTGESLEQLEFMSKMFLITDTLGSLEWKLGKESKMIGSYTCYKATAEKVVTEKQITTQEGSEEVQQEDEQKTIIVTAWYTPQIPVSQGPDDYWGLPGLIMEVTDGNTTYLCSKVVLNPKEKTEIKAPKEGDKVTQEEFDEIAMKKAKELQEMYGGGENGGAGNSSIKIQID